MVCTYAEYALLSLLVLLLLAVMWIPVWIDYEHEYLMLLIPLSLIVVCISFMVVACPATSG